MTHSKLGCLSKSLTEKMKALLNIEYLSHRGYNAGEPPKADRMENPQDSSAARTSKRNFR